MQKIKNKTWKASNGFVAQTPKIYFVILVGKQRVCTDKPQNFVLACLLGRKFSFDLFCRFARLLGGNKKAIVIKRLLFYYLFCGLLFLKSSKRFCKASFVSVSISCSSAYSFPSQSGTVSFFFERFLYLFSIHCPVFSGVHVNS